MPDFHSIRWPKKEFLKNIYAFSKPTGRCCKETEGFSLCHLCKHEQHIRSPCATNSEVQFTIPTAGSSVPADTSSAQLQCNHQPQIVKRLFRNSLSRLDRKGYSTKYQMIDGVSLVHAARPRNSLALCLALLSRLPIPFCLNTIYCVVIY